MRSNTSSEGRNAIKCLQERKDVVIKPADKGGATVVWRLDLYFQESLCQISNTDLYYPMEIDPTPHQQDIITASVLELISQKSTKQCHQPYSRQPKMCYFLPFA